MLTRVVVILCWSMVIFEGYDLVMYGTVVPSLLHYKAWHFTPALAGTFGSYVVIGMLVGALLVGMLTDWVGRKGTLVICVSACAVFMGFCAFAPTPTFFGVSRFLVGLGLGGVMPTVTALTVEYSSPARRSFTYVLMFTGYSFGGIISTALAIPLIPHLGWRAMFWVAVIPLVILVPLSLRFLPESVDYLLYKGKIDKAERIANRFQMSLGEIQKRFQITERSQGLSEPWYRSLGTLFTRKYVVATIAF